MTRKPIDIRVAADLATMACRFPSTYSAMVHYYYAYQKELEFFTKKQPSSAEYPLMPLTNNFVEFEKKLSALNECAGLSLDTSKVIDYLEAIEP